MEAANSKLQSVGLLLSTPRLMIGSRMGPFEHYSFRSRRKRLSAVTMEIKIDHQLNTQEDGEGLNFRKRVGRGEE